MLWCFFVANVAQKNFFDAFVSWLLILSHFLFFTCFLCAQSGLCWCFHVCGFICIMLPSDMNTHFAPPQGGSNLKSFLISIPPSQTLFILLVASETWVETFRRLRSIFPTLENKITLFKRNLFSTLFSQACSSLCEARVKKNKRFFPGISLNWFYVVASRKKEKRNFLMLRENGNNKL